MIGFLATSLLFAGVTPAVCGDKETVISHSISFCYRYSDLVDLFRHCNNVFQPDDLEVNAVHQGLTDLCSNEATNRKCFTEGVRQCENAHEIQTLLNVTYQFCQPYGVPFLMESFLVSNHDKVLTVNCLQQIEYDARNKCESKWEYTDFDHRPTLEEIAQRTSKGFKWFIDCFLTEDMNERVAVCNNMARKTIYGIVISYLQLLKGFGKNYNEHFLYFLEESQILQPCL